MSIARGVRLDLSKSKNTRKLRTGGGAGGGGGGAGVSQAPTRNATARTANKFFSILSFSPVQECRQIARLPRNLHNRGRLNMLHPAGRTAAGPVPLALPTGRRGPQYRS